MNDRQEAEATHYWLSTLPENIAFKPSVATAKGRWMIERDYEELKSELGLNHPPRTQLASAVFIITPSSASPRTAS